MTPAQLPFGPLGLLAGGYVRRRLEGIFDFRRDALISRFGLP